MLASKKTIGLMALLMLGLSGFSAGCGEDDGLGETIYLHVINGYPGSSQLTLYGPTGKVASGLAFGERTEEPIAVDRNVNSDDFMLLLDGAPSTIDLTKEIFALYPQETGTIVVSRRSGEEDAEMTLFRHTRTFSPRCATVFGNSLSLNNEYMADDLLTYSYQTEWQMTDQQHYDASLETEVQTRCGPTAMRNRDTQRRGDQVMSQIANDPWFFPVVGEKVGRYKMVWGYRSEDPQTGEMLSDGLTVTGQVEAYQPTEEFLECMSSSVAVKQQEDEGSSSGDTSEEEACPEPNNGHLLGEDQVVWDEISVDLCHDVRAYTGFPVDPGDSDTSYVFTMWPRKDGDEFVCGYPARVRTPEQDLIFQNIDSSVPNYVEGRGGFVQFDDTFPVGETRFFVLYGRPVNPFVAKWNSSETAAYDNGEEFAYPGDLLPSYDAP